MLIAMGVYMVAVVVVKGVICAKRNKMRTTFYLGGRKLNPAGGGDEREASGYEQLAAHGPARARLSDRYR